jgi:hypothetical protein
MSARPATRPAPPAPPAGAWLKISAALTGQVPPIADRGDLVVTCAPGAGHGSPACFFPAVAAIEVDGAHLGVDPATANPASPADRERYPVTWGALIHECAHAAHTRWSPPPAEAAAWAEAARMLEESRIEAAQTARRPADRRWIRETITSLILADFTAAGAAPASDREAGCAAALILARADAGILNPAEAAPVEQAVTTVIGPQRLGALRQIWRAAHATADDDARAMLRLGRRWCRILGVQPDPPPPPAPGAGATAQGAAGPSPVASAVSKTAAAIKAAVAAENTPAPAVPPGKAAQRAAENTARASAQRAARHVFTAPAATGQPGAGGPAAAGTRDPREEEKAAARRLARALRTATIGQRAAITTTSATPPGRLRMRQAMAASAQRAAGALPTAQPFTRTTRRRVPAPPLRVGIACDRSGSMGAYTGPVASAAWILARATASIPAAATATVTYGDTARALTWPGHAPARVTEFTADDCYEDFRGAIDALDGALDLSRPGAARLLVIISDGHYKDSQHADGQARITRLAAAGCGILWLAPDQPGNTPVAGAQVITLADPAATAAAVARAATRALRGA